jgi:hypothetical protein
MEYTIGHFTDSHLQNIVTADNISEAMILREINLLINK